MNNKEYIELLNETCKPVFEWAAEKLNRDGFLFLGDLNRACRKECNKKGLEYPFSETNSEYGWVK